MVAINDVGRLYLRKKLLARMKYLVWCLVVVLIVLQQDYWQWDDSRLVFGFLPYTMLYQAAISIGASVVWLLAVKFCWPRQVDALADDPPGDRGA